jgi:hypothetical protein
MLASMKAISCVVLAGLLLTGQKTDPKFEPYCRDAKWFDAYLRKNGFAPDDSITFRSGAVITRYRFLGDMLWLAVTPDGRGCLLPLGMLGQRDARSYR